MEVQEYSTEIEITWGENIKGEVARSEAVTDSILGYLGAHFLHKFFGEAGAAAMMATSHKGKMIPIPLILVRMLMKMLS